MYYIKGIAFIDFMLIVIAIISQLPFGFDSSLKVLFCVIQYVVYAVMTISAGLVIYWAMKGMIYKYINTYWGIFWCRYAIGL